MGRQRHAVKAISSNFAADLCAESWVGQMASRWCSGNYCTVSAFCEMFAAWAAGRVGKRDFGANTYTANVRLLADGCVVVRCWVWVADPTRSRGHGSYLWEPKRVVKCGFEGWESRQQARRIYAVQS